MEQSQTLRNSGGHSSERAAPAPEQNSTVPRTPANLGAALLMLLLIGLASPFLELQDPFHGTIGLIILLVGMQFAWKITRGIALQIFGPFKIPAPPAG